MIAGKHGRRRQRGMTLPLVALFIVVLFAFAALAIDLGILYTARTSAQHAADAGALAGAYTFINPNVLQPASAQNAAVAVAIQNKILGQGLTAGSFSNSSASPCPASSAATGVCVDTANRRVTVYIARTGSNSVGTFFARAIGWNSVAVTTRATAEASSAGTGSYCIKPMYMPNTALSSISDPTAACAAHQVIFSSQQQLSPWIQQQNPSPLGSDTQRTLKIGNPNQTLTSSQFLALDFCASLPAGTCNQGAQSYSCGISNCLNDCVPAGAPAISCNQPYPVETGNMVGPTNQGVIQLIGQNGNSSPYSWVDGSDGLYFSGPNGQTTNAPNVVTVPVWDNCTQPINSGTAGQAVNVVGFLTVFIDSVNAGTVYANVINATPCFNSPGTGPGGGGTGPQAVPIRLIQGP